MRARLPLRRAEFSPCRLWRYWLEIVWDEALPPMIAAMLNPSTADEVSNDPTVERQQRRAAMLGFGRLIVVNVFGWRSTDPAGLHIASDPVGPENDLAIRRAAALASEHDGLFLCGWGTHAERVRPGRPAEILRIARDAGAVPHALRVNRDGSPQHPLYVGYAVAPTPMEDPA